MIGRRPVMARSADSLVVPMIVPGSSLKEPALRTWIGTLNFLPNSIERLCMTPAPRLATSQPAAPQPPPESATPTRAAARSPALASSPTPTASRTAPMGAASPNHRKPRIQSPSA